MEDNIIKDVRKLFRPKKKRLIREIRKLFEQEED